MSQQVLLSHSENTRNPELIHNAVICHIWACKPLSPIATIRFTFQQVYSDLETAVQLELESNAMEISIKQIIAPLNYENTQLYFVAQARHLRKSGNFQQLDCYRHENVLVSIAVPALNLFSISHIQLCSANQLEEK